MSLKTVRISLVISTVNRVAELTRLFDSLVSQDFEDFEVLVVDQNSDDRLMPLVERYQSLLNIRRLHTFKRHGISSGRNDGWRRAVGDVIVFPDDDCWYPSWFLRKGLELLDMTAADLVSGRMVDFNGRTINGRFASRPQFITRRSVWLTQAEWTTFHRRELLEGCGGFDETLGIGSSSPWQAAEGPDLILKAMKHGRVCYYDPLLYGFHLEYDLDDPTGKMANKGRAYGRGMGYVLRRHGFGFISLLHWALRPLITAFIATINGRFHRLVYSLSVSVGRIEGWTGLLWNVGARADALKATAQTVAAGPAAAEGDVRPSAHFGSKRREMTGPYRARNPFLVGSLYTADAIAKLLPRRQKKIVEKRPLRILVANWGHLGDVVSILPLLKFLELHPQVQELGVLIGSWSRNVLESATSPQGFT